MFPVLSQDNQGNSGSGDPKPIRHFSLCYATGTQSADLDYLSGRKFGHGAFFTFKARRWSSPAFSDFVSNVIAICAKPKVIGVYTNWIIAGVQAMEIAWNRAVVQFIGKTMGGRNLPIHLEAAIPTIKMTCPFPTFGRSSNGDATPESFFCRSEPETGTVSPDKLNGLAFYMTAPLVAVFGNTRLFATTAVTVTIWNFILIWGILLHISISFIDVGHAPGRYRVAGAFSCLNYTTNWGLVQ